MPSATAPPSDPLDLVLHIGQGKTGTSSIQTFLDRNRDRLAELGWLYPRTPGATRHVRLGLSIRPEDALEGWVSWQRQGASSPEAFRRSFRRRMFREINESGLTRVLFSDEALYGSPDEALRRLRTLTDQIARSVRLVVYLRRQDDHVVSRYQQVVKTGETRRLAEWAQEMDFSRTYDYFGRLRTWERLLDPDEFVVRRFERESFVDGSLLQDFLEAAGIDARAEEMTKEPDRNISLDAESVEFLRILNLDRVENEGARVGLVDNRTLVTRLAEQSTGPSLTLPTAVLDGFMAQWEDTNRALAQRYLRDDTGELFLTPRKTQNTTTEQYLHPDRLAHFLALLELPEEVYPTLRQVAEREAKTAHRNSERKRRGPRSRRSAGQPRRNVPAHYDTAAKTVIERVRPRTMTQPEKLFGLILATRYVVANDIPGDIVECGVWRGGSMQAAALTLLECDDVTRDLHLYDTFEGMTPPQEVDRRLDGKSAAELLESTSRDSRLWGVATLDDVKAGMAEVGYPSERIHFHPGPVEDTIPRDAPDSIAILRLDTDWYASTRHELEHLYHRLSPGGVLIIDDYGYWEGARKATDEFLEQIGVRLLLLPSADGRIAVKQ